jgi:hypothetical protein
MSATPGKVMILDIVEKFGQQVMLLKFLRARKKEWVGKVFSAGFNENAIWFDDLVPEPGSEHFFYQENYI